MTLRRLRNENDDLKNLETCKSIAAEIEAYNERKMYRCPVCKETFQWNDEQYDICNARYTCEKCNEILEEHELEALNLYDYFTDSCFNLEYRIDSRGDFKSVEIMVAAGGPNIYVDTGCQKVKLYWWHQSAEYSISGDACDEINDLFQDCLPCRQY